MKVFCFGELNRFLAVWTLDEMGNLVLLLALLLFPISGALITGIGVRGLVKSEIRWNSRETLSGVRAKVAGASCIVVGVVILLLSLQYWTL
jgi:hypothetical protein